VGDEEVGEAEIGELLLRGNDVGPKINIFGLGIRTGQVVPSRDNLSLLKLDSSRRRSRWHQSERRCEKRAL